VKVNLNKNGFKMQTQDISNKLQRAYNSMVENLEYLIKEEEKTFREGVEIAEQKLSEWEELSAEEISKIRDEVLDDLETIGEVAESIRKATMEKLELDELYLKDAALEKLFQVANQSTADIIEFRENLKKHAEEATEQLHEDEHHDHKRMESEHSAWLLDIAMWQKEHFEAEEKLLAIQDRIRQHGVALQEHAQTIHAHQQEEKQHEASMSAVEKDMSNKNAEEKNAANEDAHVTMEYVHENQGYLHNDIKKHHREAMVLIEKLYKLLNA